MQSNNDLNEMSGRASSCEILLHFCGPWSLVYIHFMRMLIQPSKPGQNVRPTGCNSGNFQIVTWIIGTLCGQPGELVEKLTRKCMDIYGLQETDEKDASARIATGKVAVYKIFWVGSSTGSAGVGIGVHWK